MLVPSQVFFSLGMGLNTLIWLTGETQALVKVSLYPQPHPLFGSYVFLHSHCSEKLYPIDRIRSPLNQYPYLWSKDRSEHVVTTLPIDITQSIKKERRIIWCTLLRCLSSLLQSLGLISKILNAKKVLQRLKIELFLPLYMIRQSRSIYEDWNKNKQANVEHMNLKGINQVDINWKAKRGAYKAWLTMK